MAELIDTVIAAYNAVRASTSGLFYKFIVAIVMLLLGFIIGKILGRLVYKFLHSFDLNDNFTKLTRVTLKIEEIAETFTTYFIYFVTIVLVLQQIGLVSTILHMIAAGIIILIILSTFLGIKDFIPNAIAGFLIQGRKAFKVGQKIKVKGMTGVIIEINLLETKIETKNGDIIFIPNSVLSKTEVTHIRVDKKKGVKTAKRVKRKS
ncbi:mechanosensitive ion channel family protein [Candidatus Woesearchaeota archaeon]|nr:mechanosensitive ion channel family protein [Candidatus Woesearchaeota archaeon]